MALADGTMIKKYHVALFLNTGTDISPVWKQIRKSTDNTITMNAEMMTFDYIVDESPTDEVDRYKPSLSQPITMYKGEDDYEYLFDKFFNQDTGADAHSQILIVFYGADVATSYKAWKSDCVLVFDNMNPVESTITANINFNGTTDKGTVVVTDGVPVFTSSSETEFQMTFTVNSAGPVAQAGAVIVCGGVEKLTDANGHAVFTLIDGQTYAVGATYEDTEISDVFVADAGTTAMTLLLA
jgi:hypothetical protein